MIVCDEGKASPLGEIPTTALNYFGDRGYHSLFSSFGKVFHVEKRWKMIRDMGSGAYGVVM